MSANSSAMPVAVNTSLLLALATMAMLTDLFILRAALIASLLLLSSVPITVIVYFRLMSKGSNRALRSSSEVGLICIGVAALNIGAGKAHDFLIVENAYSVLQAVEQYHVENKKYPSSNDETFYRPTSFHGYPLRYINRDDSAPYIVFDKFNYQRQILDVRTRVSVAVGGL